MKRLTPTLACLAFLILCSPPMIARAGQPTLTYSDLINRLTDFTSPAILPEAGETCRQWSSWDRASQYDADTDKYIRWEANGDGNGIIRREGEYEVLAEMEGPGCIWRIWSALAQQGHVKIILDGADTPAIDLPFVNYFSGDTAPFNYSNLSYNLAEQGCRGQNLYFPIPYRKSCKVIAQQGWGRYYQFVFTTFPAGTQLPTFSCTLATQHASQLNAANNRLDQLPLERIDGSDTHTKILTVAGRQTLSAFRSTGAGAIIGIRARMSFQDRDDEMTALRELCLQIQFDGQTKSAVWCPLGDFFGTAPGKNLYRTYATGMTDGGFYANWYMPYASGVDVQLVNDGATARQVELEIITAPLERPFEGLGHFHCKWHRDTEKLSEDRWPDWLLLRTEGRGRFLGVMLHVWNPQGGWWGEGDEKFFVDGEKVPSTFGTGSEDYFGYAWCHPGLFQRPYHAQTMTMGNRGHQSVLRWQLVDNVPFHTSFEASIEKYFRTEEKGTLYAATVCWYLAPTGTDPYDPVPVDERHDYYVSPPPQGGGFKIAGSPPGSVQTQGMRGYDGKWDNDDHLWWTGAGPGDKLNVIVPVETTGTYDVSTVLTKARDYGIVRLSLDGKSAGKPIDLYNPSVVPTDPIPLGTFTLSKGEHQLTVEIVGANSQAVKSYMVGLDQLILTPVRQ